MRTRTLFVSALLGLGMMASCSNEELEGLENGQNQNETTYAQIAINVANSSAATKALDSNKNTGDTADGTDSENTISKITVVLADPTSNIAQYVYDFSTISSNLMTGTSDKTKLATKPFEVPEGKYKVYVLANYDAANSGLSETIQRGFEMTKAIDISDASKLYNNNFLMVNGGVKGKVDAQQNPGDGYGETWTFEGTASDKEINGDWNQVSESPEDVHLVKVNIERVVSKVTFATSTPTVKADDNKALTGATVNIEGVGIINTNNKMFLIREAKTTSNKPQSVSSNWYYPEDPNYNYKLGETGQSDADKTWLPANFDNTSVNTFTGLGQATFYCPENTMLAANQQNGQTTGVVYKIKWTLKTDGTDSPYTELAKDGTDSYSQIFAAILNLGDSGDDAKDTDITETIFSGNLESGTTANTFYAYNNLIFKNKKAAVLYQCIATATGNDNTAKAKAANKAFKTNKSETDLSALGIKEYAGGVNYYPVWIKHNPDGSNMQQGKFGVVRNHWYELTVTSISNLGNDKPTFENPEDPDDPAVANIQVAAKIKPWTIVKQDVEL